MTATLDAAPRVVIFGDYAPFPGPAVEVTLAAVRRFLAEGRAIEVVSPRPSAAHHHADPGNPRGAARLARLTAGAELHAWLDPGILGEGGALGPSAARAAVGLAVRRARSAVIHLPPLTAPPAGKWVRAILGPAERVVVASAADAGRLSAAGLDAGKLSVSDTPWWQPVGGAADSADPADPVNAADPAAVGGKAAVGGREASGGREAWTIPPGSGREAIEAEVRRRAAGDREADAANPLSASWPLHMLAPLAPSPTASSKPLFRLVKRYVHRLVAWEVVPIVEQVNHLQRATIEALDRHTESAAAELQRRPTTTP